MSMIQYNGVTIPYAFATQFRQEVIYDDQGGTDWRCTKFDLEFQAVLNFNYHNLILGNNYPALVGNADLTNPAKLMKILRSLLLRPRRRLTVQFNGVNLVPEETAGLGFVDVMNGPQPQYCNITQLTNTTFLLDYRIVANYWENLNVTANADDTVSVVNRTGNNVLFNRWSETVEMDDLMMSRRIREGKFVIRSDNPDGFIADEVRSQMAVVGVPQGFLRESNEYTVDPSGLGIEYRIVDKEVFKNPPSPAFRADGYYMESAPLYGPIRYLECYLKLWGSKATPQETLVDRAMSVVTAKIKSSIRVLVNPGQKGLPQMFLVRVGMYDNWVECYGRVMVTATKERTAGATGNFRQLTWTPLSDPIPGAFLNPPQVGVVGVSAPTPTYLDRGTAGVIIQAAAYYDPSLRNTVLSKTLGQFNVPNQKEVGQAGVIQES